MSELAFNANGESFEVPANVTGWRVRRMKPRGAPELVYGKDGRPLMIPIESEMEDLRDAVSQLGRYRLDPINEDGRTVEGVPAAYIHVVKPANAEAALPAAIERDGHDGAVREAMRLNTELAKTVIDRFPDMMTAAADLLRAADGAGIPARQRRAEEQIDGDDEEGDNLPPAGFDLNAFVGQLVPVLMAGLANGNVKMPKLAAMLDWRKAAVEAGDDEEPPTSKGTTKKKASKQKALELPPIEPSMLAHFIAIQSQLTPDEAALAREVAQELEPTELRSWFDELGKLDVADAVTKIRSLINQKTTGGVS